MTPTYRTVSVGKSVHTFNIGVRDDIALVRAYSDLPKEFYPDLCKFAALYSPAGVVIVTEEKGDKPFYGVFQAFPVVDMGWLVQSLNRFDPGWELDESGMGFSPAQSDLKLSSIQDAIKVGMLEHPDLDEQLKALMFKTQSTSIEG